jgi:hypothetical protein
MTRLADRHAAFSDLTGDVRVGAAGKLLPVAKAAVIAAHSAILLRPIGSRLNHVSNVRNGSDADVSDLLL